MENKKKIVLLEAEVKELKKTIDKLVEQNNYLRRILFGKKSENHPEGKNSNSEDGESSKSDKPKLTEDELAKIAEANRLQSEARALLNQADASLRGGRKKDQSNIVQDTVRNRVPSGIICNGCQSEVKDRGLAHKAHEIDYIPAIIINRTILLHRGECNCGEISFVMPAPPRALEQTRYSPGLISWIIAQKFKYYFPINRMEQFLDDHGLFISRQVLNGLVNRSAAAIAGIAKKIRQTNKSQPVIQCDETTICVVIEESKKRYLWCVLSPKAISFVVTSKRNREEARKILGDQAEAVLTDGLNVYSKSTIKGKHGNCMAHLRRMFFNSILSFPTEAMSVLNMIVELYKIEALAREEDLTSGERLNLRKTRSTEILGKIKEYVLKLDPPPRSSLGMAKKYLTKHWKKLTAFTRDGRLELDNNAVEREFKLAKLGLKNFLFAQSEIGCDAIADFYTLIATCRLHGVDFEEYLADILAKLESGWSQSKIEEILPWNWKPGESKSPKDRSAELTGPDGIREEAISVERVIETRGITGKVHVMVPSPSQQRGHTEPEMVVESLP